VGGRPFWKLNMSTRVGNALLSEAEIVAIQKRYVLIFVVVGPDTASRDDLVKTIQAVHFLGNQ
jgi:hypothetical protein